MRRHISILLVLFSLAFGTGSTLSVPYYWGPEGPISPAREICEENDMVQMIELDQETIKMGRPIGQMITDYGGGYGGLCSGVLISEDLFLSAQHCQGPCHGTTVKFGYLKDEENRPKTYQCERVIEAGHGFDKDYVIIKLKDKPGLEWGWYLPSDEELVEGDSLLMIHHPEGKPMHVSKENCYFKKQSMGLLEHVCDTMSGSSGSAILVEGEEGPRVVGVHSYGGCGLSPGGTNSGPAIRHLVSTSSVLKSLVGETR